MRKLIYTLNLKIVREIKFQSLGSHIGPAQPLTPIRKEKKVLPAHDFRPHSLNEKKGCQRIKMMKNQRKVYIIIKIGTVEPIGLHFLRKYQIKMHAKEKRNNSLDRILFRKSGKNL